MSAGSKSRADYRSRVTELPTRDKGPAAAAATVTSKERAPVKVGSPEEAELRNRLRAALPPAAVAENPDLVDAVSMCCLRYRRYDLSTAEERMGRYLQWRRATFGDLKPHRLADDDRLVARLETRFFMVLPDLLPTGDRVALLQLQHLHPKQFTPQESLKAWHYVIMASLRESPALQDSGVVLVVSLDQATVGTVDLALCKGLAKSLSKSIPLRLNWILMVRPSAMFRVLLPVLQFALSAKLSERFVKLREFADLQTMYGIPAEVLPPDVGGVSDFDIAAWAKAHATDPI